MKYRKYIGYIIPGFTTYEVKTDYFIIESGILNKKYSYVPIHQLADQVELKQTFLGRWMGDFGSIHFTTHNGEEVTFSQIKKAGYLMQVLPGLIKSENMRYVDALNKVRYDMYKGKPARKNKRYSKCFAEKNRFYFPGFESYFLDQDQLIVRQGIFRKQEMNIYLENFDSMFHAERSFAERVLGFGTISLKCGSEKVILRHISSAEAIAWILTKTIPQAKIIYYAYQAFQKKAGV